MNTWPVKPADSVLVMSEFAGIEGRCDIQILDYPTAALTLKMIYK